MIDHYTDSINVRIVNKERYRTVSFTITCVPVTDLPGVVSNAVAADRRQRTRIQRIPIAAPR